MRRERPLRVALKVFEVESAATEHVLPTHDLTM